MSQEKAQGMTECLTEEILVIAEGLAENLAEGFTQALVRGLWKFYQKV
jgi:hypothetical protein